MIEVTLEEVVSQSTQVDMEFWAIRYQEVLSLEDCAEIKRNLCGFFEVLESWSQSEETSDGGMAELDPGAHHPATPVLG